MRLLALVGIAVVMGGTVVAPPVALATPADQPGAVVDAVPLTTTLDARQRHTKFFAASFKAPAGQIRFVGTSLVVRDASKTKPNEIFLGVTLTCTSPSGRETSVESGRNVWPDAAPFAIPLGFTFTTDAPGTYTCQADVMMCNPGNCAAPSGVGVVRIVTRAMNPAAYSVLYVSPPLPDWAQNIRLSANGDRMIDPGSSLKVTGSIEVGANAGPVRIGAFVSVTNCIERSFPDTCRKAARVATQGSASVTPTLRLVQRVTAPGTICASRAATRATGAGTQRITWQMHHAVLAVWIDDFVLANKAGCAPIIDVTMTLSAGAGNSIVVEAKSKAKITSLMHGIPGGLVPRPS